MGRIQFEALVESAPDAIVVADASGRIALVNRRVESLFGYKRNELLGRDAELLVPEGLRGRQADPRSAALGAERETRGRRKDGTEFPIEVRLGPVQAGKGTSVIAVIRDVSAQKHLLAALQQAQAIARVGSWEMDLRTRRVSWSEEMFRIYGYEVHGFEPTFEKAMERVVPEDAERIQADLRRLIQEFRPPEADARPPDYRIEVPGHGTRLLRSTARLFGTEPGKPQLMVGTVQDVSETATAEERRQEVEHLRRIDAFKSEFISKAAHELRTPLLPIRIQTHVLTTSLSARGEPRELKALETLERNLDRLNRLIDDLLEASRVQSARLKLELVPFDLAGLVDEVVESFQPVADQFKVRLVQKSRPGVPVEADPRRLIQVLHNLLGNAMKFTPAGGVVTVEVVRDAAQARIRVADTGPGISREDLPQLFQPFSQTSAGRESRAPGTGLGLYVSKGIVDQHGGRIWAESPGPGQGATFMVELPLTAKSPQPVTSTATAAVWWRDGVPQERIQRYRELI